MADKLAIYNAALLHVGERKILSLSENRECRRIIDSVWDDSLTNSVLQSGLWNFSIRTVAYTYSPSVTPPFGYRRAFNKPVDWVRTAGVAEDEFFSSPLIRYVDEGGFWFSDLDTIYVRYVSNDSQFGGDLGLWPDNFTTYVEYYIATKIVIRITQSETRKQELEKDMQKALNQAKSTDAMDQPAMFPPPGNWSTARLRRFTRRDRGGRGSLLG